MSAPLTASSALWAMAAPAASSSASEVLALFPAPACTTTSAPRFLYFLTISGVIAARVSTGSVSERTVIRLLPPCRSCTKLEVGGSERGALHHVLSAVDGE